jgi:hypothetical protein
MITALAARWLFTAVFAPQGSQPRGRGEAGRHGARAPTAFATCPTALRSSHIEATTEPPEWPCSRTCSDELPAGITHSAGTPFAVASR